MKAGFIILSFYILVLSGIACCAFDQCPDENGTAGQGLTHKEKNDRECANCPPFSSCEGCFAVSAIVDPLSLTIATVLTKQIYTGFLSPYVSDVHYDFWQPPKPG